MIQSPCVARCGLNEDDFCMGCLRHIDEIVNWSRCPDEEKRAIIAKLPERKHAFSGMENIGIISRAKYLEAEARLGRSDKSKASIKE